MAAIFENGRPFVKVHFKKGPDLLTLNVDSYVLGTLIVSVTFCDHRNAVGSLYASTNYYITILLLKMFDGNHSFQVLFS